MQTYQREMSNCKGQQRRVAAPQKQKGGHGCCRDNCTTAFRDMLARKLPVGSIIALGDVGHARVLRDTVRCAEEVF